MPMMVVLIFLGVGHVLACQQCVRRLISPHLFAPTAVGVAFHPSEHVSGGCSKASGDILCEFKQLTDAELIDDVAHVVEFSTGYISATIFLSPMVVRPAHHDGRDVEEMWRAGLVLS